jgi:hypothetical protein
MLLCSPVSVSLYLHLLVLSDLLFFSTSAPQPSFTVSVMHLCSLLLLCFMLCAPCPFYALFLFYAFQLLHSTSFYTPESLSTTATITSFFYIPSLCAPSASYMHNSSAPSTHCHCFSHQDVHSTPHCHCFPLEHQHPLSVLHVLLVSSPLLDHHGNSSAFLAVIPMHSSSLGVMLRFLSLSSSRDSSSSLS